MAFSIRFLDVSEYPSGAKSYYLAQADLCLGRLTIGTFEESFEAPLVFWKKHDYAAQWQEGLNRIIQGASVSCVITSMYDPTLAEFLVWWSLYRDGQRVIFQHHLFFLKDAPGRFDLKNPYAFVRKHDVVNEDGQRISQWITSVDDINEWLGKVTLHGD